ncbi:hypothetical protein [Pseudomonas fluorescens]|uniref:hypothetical protein n=1 Tax=Pseudomonas fluorescens TaxID=294 RepID=UPI001241BA04|nr:hypothetical protein [Pseudomonas fluorescens]
MFVPLDKVEILLDIFVLAMLLPQERLAQKIESHRFLERQASKYFISLMVFSEGSHFPEVRALHVRERKHEDLLLIDTAELCRNAQSSALKFFWGLLDVSSA